tara:strand:- start:53 stop:364 length:312 start_codon:yes stop_codon:yes gene_type:complete
MPRKPTYRIRKGPYGEKGVFKFDFYDKPYIWADVKHRFQGYKLGLFRLKIARPKDGRQEQYGSWGSKASAKRQMKKVGLEGWAIKQKGNQWALFRPSKKGGKK